MGVGPETRTVDRSAALPALAIAACALCAGTVAFSLAAAAPGTRAEAAVIHGIMVAVPAGVGLAVLRRRPADRFALLLLATAFLLALTTLAESSHAGVYSTGRTVVWLVEPVIAYLLLAFPSGRLTTGSERVLFGAIVFFAGLLYLPTALLAPFPVPSPWSTCGVDCPSNAFALTDVAFVEDVVRPVREVLTVVLFSAVAVVLARRMRATATLGRCALAPVLAAAILRSVTIGAYFVARRDGGPSPLLDTIGWIFLLSLPLIALGFGAGLLAARLHVAGALERLTARVRAGADATELRPELADALGDPSVRIAYALPDEPGRWVDEAGRPVAALHAPPGRTVTEVRASGRLAAIEHDAGLTLEPGIVQAAATYALAVAENDRLVAELRRSLAELSASRARLLSVGDQARRRIERDLHDGAQQRLVALRTRLALESERLRKLSGESVATTLERMGEEVEMTIDEVRSIARGIYPSLLADRGLPDALRAAAMGAPIPARADCDGIGRYAHEIEATVYFACIEALQNAVKHARGATGVWISLADTGRLRFEVRDDGAGFDPSSTPAGAGLTNLRDRLAALDGVLMVRSAPGAGTRVAGVVPARLPRFDGAGGPGRASPGMRPAPAVGGVAPPSQAP